MRTKPPAAADSGAAKPDPKPVTVFDAKYGAYRESIAVAQSHYDSATDSDHNALAAAFPDAIIVTDCDCDALPSTHAHIDAQPQPVPERDVDV